MAYYAQTAYPTLPPDASSLVIAFTNLLTNYDYAQDPIAVAALLTAHSLTIDWQSLPKAYDGFRLAETNAGDTWPYTLPAIVQLRRMDTATAGAVDHFCLVADPIAGTIIDSLDGETRPASTYGPIQGWASYTYDDAPLDELSLAPERPGKRYQLQTDETVWTVARKFKISPTKLMDHNEISDPKTIKAGSWLYIPVESAKEKPRITYRLLDAPYKMHIAHAGGTTKFTFGGVKKWTDIKADLKHYGDGVNVDIYAVAKVPVEDTIAAFYMDKHDVGDYLMTGRPAYTRGFNWQHLAEGSTKAELPTITHQEITASAMLEDDRPSIVDEVQPVVTAALEAAAPVKPTITVTGQVTAKDDPEAPQTAPDDYKATFQYLNVNEEPELYELVSDTVVREMDGAARTVQKRAGDRFPTKGWFTHEGTPYYRVDSSLWYAVPTQFAVSVENQPFNSFTPTLEDKLALGATLTRSERRTVLLAKTAAKYKKGATITMNIIRQLRQK